MPNPKGNGQSKVPISVTVESQQKAALDSEPLNTSALIREFLQEYFSAGGTRSGLEIRLERLQNREEELQNELEEVRHEIEQIQEKIQMRQESEQDGKNEAVEQAAKSIVDKWDRGDEVEPADNLVEVWAGKTDYTQKEFYEKAVERAKEKLK